MKSQELVEKEIKETLEQLEYLKSALEFLRKDIMVSTHFNRKEFQCKCGCGFCAVDVELLDVLEKARKYFSNPVLITSGCRCEAYNKSIGGASKSKHVKAIASDIAVKNVPPDDVAEYFEGMYPDKYGIGRYTGWTHIDVRETPARWDKR